MRIARYLFILAVLAAGQALEAQTAGDLYSFAEAPGVHTSYGCAVSGAGDVNADGYEDILIGVPMASGSGVYAGDLRVLSGKDAALLHLQTGDLAFDDLAAAVSDAGDFDGDGFADYVAAAFCPVPSTNLGYVRAYSGKSGAPLQTWYGTSLQSLVGASISGAGDFDSDGTPDVLVGARYDDTSFLDGGKAEVLSVTNGVLFTLLGSKEQALLGYSVSDAGDVNMDGFVDIVIGVPTDGTNGVGAGAVEVYSGKNGSLIHKFLGSAFNHALGRCVSDVGDVNSDGYDDVASASIAQYASFLPYAMVFSGANGTVLHTFGGPNGANAEGEIVSGAGDINSDGHSDVVVKLVYPISGVVVHSGLDGSELFRRNGEYLADKFGDSISDVGDMNGDGSPEIIVGSPYPGSPDPWLTEYVKVITPNCGTIAVVGQGCAGSAPSVPSLTAAGCPVPGGEIALTLANGSFTALPALLVVGAGTTSLPMAGGCWLLVSPPLATAWVSTGFLGLFHLVARIPVGIPLGIIAVQGFIPDPAAPSGFRNSNALAIDVL